MATSLKQGTNNGRGEVDRFDIAAPHRSRSRIPEIALGLLIVAAFGLGSLWFFTQATEKADVLVLASAVNRGEVLDVGDLIVARVNTDDALAALDRSGTETVVGRVALVDMPAGTVVTPSLFAAGDTLEPGEGVVGLELDAGEIPSLRLHPGATVSVVLTPRVGGTDELSDGGALEAGEVLVDAAVVIESAPVGAQGRQFIALLMTRDEATAVSSAASLGRVRLFQVAGDS